MKEFYKYFIVGVAAAVIDIFSFSFLAWKGVYYIVANVVSTCLGLAFNYYFSCTWVFHQKKINVKRDFLPFAAIGAVGLGIQCVLLFLLIDLKLAFWSVNLFAGLVGSTVDRNTVYFLSKVFVTGVTFLWNFFLRKYLVFRRAEKLDALTDSTTVTSPDDPDGDILSPVPEQHVTIT